MDPDCILINAEPGQTRIALLGNGRLMELRIARPDDGPRVGDVYVGRVEKVLPGIKAAFVDIGKDRSGFLMSTHPVKEGDAVRVQVQREAYGDKGAKLTRTITADGLPDTPSGERPPVCLHRAPDPVRRMLRDQADAARVVVDDRLLLRELKAYCEEAAPTLVDRLEAHLGPEPIFDAYGVADQMEEAFNPMLRLPSGGSIIITETAALTAIDVNTGAASETTGQEQAAYRSNMEAAVEVARQVRLRNIAGLIVVDFVSMRNKRRGANVLDALREAVASDTAPVNVAGYTRLGLMEMTRGRRDAPLSHILCAPCSTCGGSGRTASALSVALEILRRVRREADAAPGAALSVTAAPTVIDALTGPAAAALAETERRLGRRLALTADKTLPVDMAPDMVPDMVHVGFAKKDRAP